MSEAADHEPWEGREATVFWKGNTGNHADRRVALNLDSLKESDAVDIQHFEWTAARGGPFEAQYVSFSDHCHHK